MHRFRIGLDQQLRSFFFVGYMSISNFTWWREMLMSPPILSPDLLESDSLHTDDSQLDGPDHVMSDVGMAIGICNSEIQGLFRSNTF
jgi:hypothetical protein